MTPNPKITILSNSKFINALLIVLYKPNITKMYDPETPGKIIAQLAINPAKNINIKFSFKLFISGKLVNK